MIGLTWLQRSRNATVVVITLALSLVGVGVVMAAPSTLSFTPQKADQITNIDVLRQEIANYYGDPAKSGTFAADSNYAKEASSVAAAGSRWLAAMAGKSPMQAIVLDVDDTTLTTWNYETFSNWAYNPGTNATYVLGEKFPATPGMVDMVEPAAAEGYAIFFITGRPTSQYDATLANLTTADVVGGISAGYPTPEELFTKPAVGSYPAYLDTPEFCADAIATSTSCHTVPYKAGTRAYIESLGYDIVADFGDQYSDLFGGYTDQTFKMPNPNYYLP